MWKVHTTVALHHESWTISREVGSGHSSQLKHVMWPFNLASPRSHDVRGWTARCFNMNCRRSTRNGSDTLRFSQANHIEHGSALCRNCWNSLCPFRSLSKVKLSSAVEVKVHFSCILRFHQEAKDPFVNLVLTHFLVVEDQDWCSPQKTNKQTLKNTSQSSYQDQCLEVYRTSTDWASRISIKRFTNLALNVKISDYFRCDFIS